jgi:hypothetical protein
MVHAGGGGLLRTRWLVRAPVWLYRARLGILLGPRFVMLEHTGRKSGARRYVVLEVVQHRAAGSYVVVSGFGVFMPIDPGALPAGIMNRVGSFAGLRFQLTHRVVPGIYTLPTMALTSPRHDPDTLAHGGVGRRHPQPAPNTGNRTEWQVTGDSGIH